ncbi:hypothetical protein LZ554_003567 [Drepanopeziza brunnea f. sp. 'monogermtubi']|nr:hypothetical protein LZ554_003567 [Drepanopeziza brunnea f. sp. 'monogermtubi']
MAPSQETSQKGSQKLPIQARGPAMRGDKIEKPKAKTKTQTKTKTKLGLGGYVKQRLWELAGGGTSEDGTAAYLKKRVVEMVWGGNTVVDEVESVAGGETGESAGGVTSGGGISSAESIASTEAITATEMEAVTPMEAITSPDDITSEEAIASLEEIASTKYDTVMKDTTSATGEQKGETATNVVSTEALSHLERLPSAEDVAAAGQDIKHNQELDDLKAAVIDHVNGSVGGKESNLHSETARSDPDRCSFGNAFGDEDD